MATEVLFHLIMPWRHKQAEDLRQSVSFPATELQSARSENDFTALEDRVRLAQYIAAATISLVSTAPTAAAAEPIRELCPDRPGKDSPPCIIDKGHLMLEFGAVRYSKEDDRSVYEFGETLARYGLTESVELQMSFSPYTQVNLTEADPGTRRTLHGPGDLTAAIKANLRNPDGKGTSIAIQGFVTVPTGKNGIGAEGWEGGVIIPISFELTDQLGITLDPEIDIRADEDGHGNHLAFAGVVSVGRDLGSGFEGSAEVWSMIDQERGNRRTEASFDVALAWTPEKKSNVQFDVEADFGLTHDTPKIEMSAGVAVRF